MKQFSLSLIRIILAVLVVMTPFYLIWGQIESIHREIRGINSATHICQSFQMRAFHYIKPHKPFEWIEKSDGSGLKIPYCEECADLLREAGLFDELGVWIEQTRLDELLEKEQQLAEILKPVPMSETEQCLKQE